MSDRQPPPEIAAPFVDPHTRPIARVLASKVSELGTERTARALGVGRAQVAGYLGGLPLRRGTILAMEQAASNLGWLGAPPEEAERAVAQARGLTVAELRARLGER